MSERVPDRRMLIDGELVGAVDGGWLESVNPATGQEIGRVPAGGEKDVERAVTAAEAAFVPWSRTPPEQRARLLREFAARLNDNGEWLAELETADTGNTISTSRFDVDFSLARIDYYAGLAHEAKGETLQPSQAGVLNLSLRVPYGVVGRILPFNHPLMFAATRVAAPLVSGNTLVIKPCEQSPLSTVALAEIVRDVFPPGVVNIVTGLGKHAGDALVRHPNVRRLAFIGSVPTGLAIQRSAAEVSVKHVTLELGGKNPMIVFPDADFDAAMAGAVRGMNFAWQGQSCGSTSRLFLHADIYDRGVQWLRENVAAIRVGDPADPSTEMGPINSSAQLEKDLNYIASAHQDGARLITGGDRPAGAEFEHGYWLRPTVFADVTPNMRIFGEEVFGPVLSVIRWRDIEDVIDWANRVEYGLTASVWSNDLRAAFDTIGRLHAGYCWINDTSRHYLGTNYGGVKNSGVGREEGLEELLSYTEVKTVNLVSDPAAVHS
ncbi:aldehyde dehydrogenase family protein [Mycobacterium intracellulare]|uniref:aldehyde dehydrogenase family protein n=1 Tax=Mycobacterium intracellulare TaxID=1767 RepID=UPI00334D636A